MQAPASCPPKNVTRESMLPSYDPLAVEDKWPEWWRERKYFHPEAKENVTQEKFVMVIPPPNVTGSMHIGHALMVAIEDTLTRWHRMKGHTTLWVPGVDHAGIATQSVVEKALWREETLTRHDLGREKFLEKVMQWKGKYGSRIIDQLRWLGSSCDWEREAFTMNPNFCEAVNEAFVRLHEKGLLYRESRLVSWCPYLRTALSEIEVDLQEIDTPTKVRVPGFDFPVETGVLWHFKYLVRGEPETYIEVATTRIETMLGDTAVAVNPEDERYKHLIGKELVHPYFPERDIRVIGDTYCDPTFGSGAVKITPAHDKNDYEIGKRHGLDFITIFTLDGHVNENGGKFQGMHRFECRFKIVKDLEELGLMVGKSPNPKMQLPRCSRSDDIIEYMLLPQWWVNCAEMGKRAAECVRDGSLRLTPNQFEQTWYHFLDNIRDWCVSRQLWWGHRIPAYVVKDRATGEAVKAGDSEIWIVARNAEEARTKFEKEKTGKYGLSGENYILEQDSDVLDTWFSSGLFPFACFGWPDVSNPEFSKFFPTSVLETGHDILFFWVARMVMLSQELVGQLPFHDVILHPIIRDSHGKKMSKSLGNVIDPVAVIQGITLEALQENLKSSNLPEKELARALEVQKKDFPKGIPQCGADALRFGLLSYTKQPRSINLDINRIVSYRFFCNKLWNATKFALGYFPDTLRQVTWNVYQDSARLEWVDSWILHRLNETAAKIEAAMPKYDFEAAVTAIYNFWLYELCDVYLELIKPRLQNEDLTVKEVKEADMMHPVIAKSKEMALKVLFISLETGLRLIHPMMPFVSEELWQRVVSLTGDSRAILYPESICIAEYPQFVRGLFNPTVDAEFGVVKKLVGSFRSLLHHLEVPPKLKLNGYVLCEEMPSSSISREFLYQRCADIATLAKMNEVRMVSGTSELPLGCVGDVVNDKITVFLDPAGSVNFDQVCEKLLKKLSTNEKLIETAEKKMKDPNYEQRVPEDIRQRDMDKLTATKAERDELDRALEMIKEAMKNSSP